MIIGDMGREEGGEKREMEGILITLQRVEMGVEGDRNLHSRKGFVKCLCLPF